MIGVIFKGIFLIGALIAVFRLGQAFALADPDAIQIESVHRYDDVAVVGDAFFLVEYTLNYTVLPDESISQGWLGRLIDVGGSGQLGSLQPFSGGAIPDLGYSRGTYGFYFDVEPTITGTLRVTLEGNPSFTPFPTGTFLESITQRDAADLAPDLRDLALRFEDIWDVDLISPLFGGINRYTEIGEEYFASSLPNLRNVAPDMFILHSILPGVPDRAFDTTYTDTRRALFDGTTVKTGFAQLAIFLNISETVARFIVALVTAVTIAYLVGRLPMISVLGFASTMQIWVVYLVMMGGFWLGMVNAQTLGIMTVIALMATTVVFFLQRTSA